MVYRETAVGVVNPLKALNALGQSIWLDYIRRSLITSGDLLLMIEKDELRGVTSNPAIFEKAIGGSTDYNDALKALQQEDDHDAQTLYERLAIADIQAAADVMRSVYETTKRRDGYVSLEVSPYLANDTEATIVEARRLWKTVDRPNVMIKVPATPAGVPAIRQLIADGINVNVTLLFAQSMYETVAEAYLSGLEALAASGADDQRIGGVASVASFFISRIDTAVDARIAARLTDTARAEDRQRLQGLAGKVAIANAKLTYERYREIYATPRWRALAARGAQTQRLLWASTGTKNPAYRDVAYIEELIGPDTVNTVPPATLDAFRDHGVPRASLTEAVAAAHRTMDALAAAGIPMADVTAKLLDEAVRLFADAFDKLLGAVERKRVALLGDEINRQTFRLPQALDHAVTASLDDWRINGKVRRLWALDASLWTGADEARWMGWLGITDDQLAHVAHFTDLAAEVARERFAHAVLLGMGGSSLGPEVMKVTFGRQEGFPELHVLDSTDPAQVRALEKKIDLANSIFIVSSKSGGTLEPNIFKQYFFDRVTAAVGAETAAQRFIAITDPGSHMQQVAERDRFRHVFFGLPSIGGRYSVLSAFGMIPATIMGVDVPAFLDRAEEMVHSCAPSVPPDENPGVVLGTILGVAGTQGRDKVTLFASPGIARFGAWLEQLIAESTGKQGMGLIPIDTEAAGEPSVYGDDRLFVYVRLESEPDAGLDAKVAALEAAGHPVIHILMADRYELGEEFFRWEMATAVAGSILAIHPFNQPDVEASKLATKALTAEYENSGSLPAETPVLEAKNIRLYTDAVNARALAKAAASPTLAAYLKAHLDRLGAGDYLALLAYVEMNDVHEELLQRMRHMVRDRKRVATCLGFGPRFLHSTGQAYKGGPNSGVFLQITCDDAEDLAVPGQRYTFGIVKAAQARGDFDVLAERGRRALRVHLGADVRAGLATLAEAIDRAL
jgi:transaldolase/glucose-6-phosphate isomerase